MRRKKKSLRLPNKYGGVVFLGERRRRPYAARVTTGWSADHKQIYKYLGYFERREDALACLADFYREPYDASARRATLAQIFEEWSEKHAESVSKASMQVYKTAYKKMERLHNSPLSELRAAHFQTVIEGQVYSSARMVKILVGLLYNFAIKKEIVNKNVADLLELPKKNEKKQKKPFSVDEINMLWSREGELHADMLLILLYSGLRISELFEMETEKIDLSARVMVGGLKTEAGRDRTIPIHRKIAPIIERVCGDKYLFQSPRGKKYLYSNEGLKINRYMKAIGLSHTIHETRHTFISQCDRLKLPALAVKRIVGHSTKDITEHYTHKNADDLVQIIDVFDY